MARECQGTSSSGRTGRATSSARLQRSIARRAKKGWSVIVKQAASAGQRVKVVGSGHSFTGIALTDGRLVKLDDYNRVLSVDREKSTATVQAGHHAFAAQRGAGQAADWRSRTSGTSTTRRSPARSRPLPMALA